MSAEAYYDFELDAAPHIDPNRAACLDEDPEVFFPPSTNERGIAAAKAICATCNIVDRCLEENINMEYGVVGNTSEKERRALRRRGKRNNFV